MINLAQLRALVVKPALTDLGLYSEAAEELLIGTGLAESGFVYLRQLPDGPALGFWQMEPATHDDLWENWLRFRVELVHIMRDEVPRGERTAWPTPSLLITNLRYAAMMARLQYYRQPEPLPAATDIEGLAHYWKRYWATAAGKGKPEHFVWMYTTYVLEDTTE